MLKGFTVLLLVLVAGIVNAQEKKVYWITEVDSTTINSKLKATINSLFGVKYVLLKESTRNLYEEVDLDKDGKKEVVLILSDTTSDEAYGAITSKVLIFTNRNTEYVLLDSSNDYANDGRGTYVNFENKVLSFEMGFHHGHSIL